MRAPVLLLLVLLALPLGSARAEPMEGRLRDAAGLSWDGEVSARSPEGTLDLSAALAAGERVSLAFDGGTATRVVYETRGVAGVWDSTPRNASRTTPLGAGTLASVACHGACTVLLFPEDGAGDVSLSGRASGPLPWTTEATRFCGFICAPHEPHFRREVAAGALHLVGQPAAPGGLFASHAAGEGRLALFFAEATVHLLQEGQEPVVLDARERRRPLAGLDAGGAYEGESAFVLLVLDGARFTTPAPTRAALLAPSPRLDVAGTLSSPSASGELRLAGDVVRFQDEAVEMRGRVGMETRMEGGVPALRTGVAQGALAGDVERVRIGGRVVHPAPRVEPTVLEGTAGVAGVAALLLVMRQAALLLYSRITASDVLANGNRLRLYTLVRERPGHTLADLTRALRLSRVVVQHHLRILEAPRLVVGRGAGRGRTYFAPESLGEASLAAARAALRTPARARLALHLLEHGPATQKDLAARTGLSQRLVSYHLARLEAVALVRGEGGGPRRYLPTEGLRLALAERPLPA